MTNASWRRKKLEIPWSLETNKKHGGSWRDHNNVRARAEQGSPNKDVGLMLDLKLWNQL
jgi:hypothetical protein